MADGRPYGSVEPRRLRSPAAVAAAVGAEAADFHRALAVLDDARTVAPGVEVHFWRWRGGLTGACCAVRACCGCVAQEMGRGRGRARERGKG